MTVKVGKDTYHFTPEEAAAVNAELGGSANCTLGPNGEVTEWYDGDDNNPRGCGVWIKVHSRGWRQRFANVAGGVLNAASFGNARTILSATGAEDKVDYDSPEFKKAELAATAIDVAFGVGAAVKGVRAVRAARGAGEVVSHVDDAARAVRGGSDGAGAVRNAAGDAAAPRATSARSGDDFVDLYRHVDDVELADIRATGIIRSGPSGTGKYFAETADDATTCGQWLNPGQGGVVGTRVPRSFADELMRWQKLDNIGPARFVPPELLGRLNDVSSGIRFL